MSCFLCLISSLSIFGPLFFLLSFNCCLYISIHTPYYTTPITVHSLSLHLTAQMWSPTHIHTYTQIHTFFLHSHCVRHKIRVKGHTHAPFSSEQSKSINRIKMPVFSRSVSSSGSCPVWKHGAKSLQCQE